MLSADGSTAIERSAQSAATAAADTTLQTISGYAYGLLGYFHQVTTGTFPGTVYLSSPEHGLAAGQRSYGSGKLLYVNLPLGYFKAIGTDSAPMHGFMGRLDLQSFAVNHRSNRRFYNVTRLLPKSSYTLPRVISGWGTVSSDANHWIVTAEWGNTLKFITTAR